jgi:RND family efflux transporter MFP subunit
MSTESQAHQTPRTDLSRLRIPRDEARTHRWVPWAVGIALVIAAIAGYRPALDYLAARRAPEVDIARVTRAAVASGGGSASMPVLVASGYVVARRSADVGGKVGGRLEYMGVEEGDRVRAGQVIARIEHGELDAQLAASKTEVVESRAQVSEAVAARDEAGRDLDRQRTLRRDGIVTEAAVTSAQAAFDVAEARVELAQAALASAEARVRVVEENIENTNVRAPFTGVVIAKRAELGETVSPYGVMGQASREGGAIATIADLAELEVETEVSETNVSKLVPDMPAEVRLQAYQDTFRGRLRQIFPAADRAKAIVEVRVSILNPDERVRPEMSATVTFVETSDSPEHEASASPAVLIPKRAVVERNGQSFAWVVADGRAAARPLELGTDRIDLVEVVSGVVPGEAVIINPPEGITEGGPVKLRNGGGRTES